MDPLWPAISGYSTESVVPAALAFLDRPYLLGMLRAIIPSVGDGWEELSTLVLVHERGEESSASVVPKALKRLVNGQGNAFIAGRAAHNILRTGGERVGYSWFAAACDAILCEPEDAPGDARARAVNSLVEDR